MHGGTLGEVRAKIKAMKERKERENLETIKGFGMAVYVILRDSEAEAKKELERIINIKNWADYENSYSNFTGNSNLDVEISKMEYSVSNRGLRANLIGTAEQIAEKLRAYEEAGLNLVIIQCANMKEELERIAKELMPLLR